MKQSLVTLFLCCSALSAAAQAGKPERMPWADRAPVERAEIPMQKESAGAKLSDFGFGVTRGAAAAPWVEETISRYNKEMPAGESNNANDYDIQVFISAGMPEGVLRHLFAQAMDYPQGRVRFVVRGFTPQKLGPLVAKLRGLFPDPYSDHIALEVDPNAFRTYGVEAVPVYLVREEDKWYEVQGSQSLQAAQKNVKNRSKKVVGELYAIEEPDILAVIEQRAKNFDWKPVLERAQQRVAKNLKPGFDLPTANRDSTAYTVPTFTVPHDINSPGQDGKSQVAIAKGGQVINLLDHVRLQVPVIVFDASDARQVAMVKRWLARPEMKEADLFVIGSSQPASDSKTPVSVELGNAFKRPVFPWLAKLSERMGVEAVPAIVEQEGGRLRVRYFNPENR